MEDALADAEVLDIRGLLSRGCRLLDLEPGVALQPPVAAAADDDERPEPLVDELEGAVGGEVEGAVALHVDGADADDEATSTSGTSSEFVSPELLKRSTSLKSGKTPPQTPGRKKFVRFADAMGLDLQKVHTFRDEIPTVPAAAFRGLDADVCAPPPPPPATFQMTFGSAALGGGAPGRHLVAMFLQPGGSLGFLDRLQHDRVSLENVVCRDDDLSVRGIVRVLNMDFCKVVRVRYTLDEWRTSAETQAEYVPGSCDGLSDRFTFTLYASTLTPGQRLQFVVQFECQGQTFWDNNGGQNYSVQLIMTSTSPTTDDFGGCFY
ncbi:glycogen-binding subunit 76A-like [Pollicipes pollicipes]|uniref:glycogen-binding subunit 76A-like n=1 Tax=Pollicipes pollicipes TaxID=41117 RepID=UPI0018852E07|nr:glycogen-binding subunit 76A-like [Pollicipes pollicipes]